ncbi:hypothetical protein ACIQVO_37460 [Streptomyces sp. NPDC101062]|uniref:hypothetical protein n=1 Tax=unclassified Streptomyces TaxID=2593676 RepID=UPI003828B84C
METRAAPLGESERLSAWLAIAAPDPALAAEQWRQNPRLPRRIQCGITFDVVLADRGLLKSAYEILHRYRQPLGPAVIFEYLREGAVLVPRGTAARWRALVGASAWPERMARPVCLGLGHAIRVPAVESVRAADVRWLVAPDMNLPIGPGPLLTGPAQLARCLAEARSPRPAGSFPRGGAIGVMRAMARAPERT